MPSVSIIRVAVRPLLSFFDTRPKDSVGHASAITGLLGEDLIAALTSRYLEEHGASVVIRSEPVTTGKKRGFRLDRWIEVTQNNQRLLFQTEIKNWGSHSSGGRTLACDVDVSSAREHRLDR
jgi:hypothetical protein